MEAMSMKENIISTNARRPLAMLVLIVVTVALFAPKSALAITQLSCPDGLTMRYVDDTTNLVPSVSLPLVGEIYSGVQVTHNYQQVCLDAQGNTSAPTETEVASCAAGYIQAYHGTALTPLLPGNPIPLSSTVCVPVDTTQYQA